MSDDIDANDNIWTWLGQDITRVQFAHFRFAPWGHLRSVTSVNLTFTLNHRICDYNRFLRWWIRFERFFYRLCFRGRYTNHMCMSTDPWRHKSDLWRHRCDTASSMSTIQRRIRGFRATGETRHVPEVSWELGSTVPPTNNWKLCGFGPLFFGSG